MRRRSASSSLRSICAMSTPSYRISPAVGRSSRRMQRPVVVLPQPLSPTSPSVSPRRTVKSMPSTAFTSPTSAARDDALGDREVHAQPLHLEQRRGRSRSCRRSGLAARPRGCGSRRPDGRRRLPAPAAAAPAAHASTAKRQRGRNAQPRVEPRQIGRLAFDRIEPLLARPVQPRHRAQQRHRVGMARVVVDRRPPGRSPPGGRHTSRSPDWRSARRRRDYA